MARNRKVLSLSPAEAVLVRDALEVLNPDNDRACRRRDELLGRLVAERPNPKLIIVITEGIVRGFSGIPKGMLIDVREFDTDLDPKDERVEKFAGGLAFVTRFDDRDNDKEVV